MKYYIPLVKFLTLFGNLEFTYDIYSKRKLSRDIIKPYNDGYSLLIKSKIVMIGNIEEIKIFELSEKDLPVINRQLIESTDHELCLKEYFIGCPDLSKIFLNDENKNQRPRKTLRISQINSYTDQNMVFIVHGHEKEPALELQKHLKAKNIEAKIFDDLKEENTGNTIIELLEYIKDTVAYAFVVATPDDLGCLNTDYSKYEREILLNGRIFPKDLDRIKNQFRNRARQNVVFELGLFMGSIGRDRVCCLLHKMTSDKPSDIAGILYVPFEITIKETFEEIDKKLEDPKIGLIKN